jgi:hypothetical protein
MAGSSDPPDGSWTDVVWFTASGEMTSSSPGRSWGSRRSHAAKRSAQDAFRANRVAHALHQQSIEARRQQDRAVDMASAFALSLSIRSNRVSDIDTIRRAQTARPSECAAFNVGHIAMWSMNVVTSELS